MFDASQLVWTREPAACTVTDGAIEVTTSPHTDLWQRTYYHFRNDTADVKSMWYRLSRREDDYCIECSRDGRRFSQMRVCHMWEGADSVRFGIYACSPEDSSFLARFTGMDVTECKWLPHDGQQPDATE